MERPCEAMSARLLNSGIQGLAVAELLQPVVYRFGLALLLLYGTCTTKLFVSNPFSTFIVLT
jgi:hypothetical protein